jgi:hypothetical protein
MMYGTNHGIPGIRKFDSEFKLLDMRFHYNDKVLYKTFENIGADGVKAYRNYLWLDFCFIACFLIIMLALSLKLTAANIIFRNILIGLAISRALFDILENTLLIILLNAYPQQNAVLSNICSWSTTLKFIALYLWIAGIAVILLLKLLRLY